MNLTAVADAGVTPTGWTGAACTGSPCAVTMDGAKTVEPTFVAQYTLQVSPVPVHGLVTGDRGSRLREWRERGVQRRLQRGDGGEPGRGGGRGVRPYRVDGDGVHGVAVRGDDRRAEDGRPDVVAQCTLQVSPVPLHGLVTGDGGLSCGVGGTGTCSAAFNAGTVVNLTAVADTGYALTGWTGTVCTGSPCAVTMDGPKTVEPTFVAQYTLQVSPVPLHGLVTGDGGLSCGLGGTGVCSAAFNAGTVVNLAAVADPGTPSPGGRARRAPGRRAR